MATGRTKKAATPNFLREDVAAMIRDAAKYSRHDGDTEALADDIILVVRERVLREIQSYARKNIR